VVLVVFGLSVPSVGEALGWWRRDTEASQGAEAVDASESEPAMIPSVRDVPLLAGAERTSAEKKETSPVSESEAPANPAPVAKKAPSAIVADWCARVVNPMNERFHGRYPFDAQASGQVSLADFEEFFHPKSGVIRTARKALLAEYLVLSRDTIKLRAPPEGPRVDPTVVRFLNRAHQISSVMFVDDELRVDFDIFLGCNPQVSRIVANIEGVEVVYNCGDRFAGHMRWPGTGDHGASLTAFGRFARKTFNSDGEWGVFRLFEFSPSSVPESKGEEGVLFYFDLTAYNLGQIDVLVVPTRVRGGSAFFGLSGGEGKYLSLLRTGDVLPPKRLFADMAGCDHK
jgi:hypothetical protein